MKYNEYMSMDIESEFATGEVLIEIDECYDVDKSRINLASYTTIMDIRLNNKKFKTFVLNEPSPDRVLYLASPSGASEARSIFRLAETSE